MMYKVLSVVMLSTAILMILVSLTYSGLGWFLVINNRGFTMNMWYSLAIAIVFAGGGFGLTMVRDRIFKKALTVNELKREETEV